MNFDTKYLIRWGIPGWIMVMVLLPYFIVKYFEILTKHVSNSSDLLAVGAVLTVLGVPLGYLLNQIHHSLFWILPRMRKRKWDKYFEQELLIDEYFSGNGKAEDKIRYSYLLSRKHELGGISVSLGISEIVILITNLVTDPSEVWSWWYFIIVNTLFLILFLSRLYSSENIDKYHYHYLNKVRPGRRF